MRPHRWQPTGLPRPWDSPGKITGVGCHFLLQCMNVKSESEVAQSCPTPSDPMDCGLPGSSVHGIFQARVLEWGAIAFSDCMTKGPQIWCSVTTQRGGMGWEVAGRFKREGTCVYLWLLHVDVWNKPTQYCKVIILQLKQFFRKEKISIKLWEQNLHGFDSFTFFSFFPHGLRYVFSWWIF